MTAAHSTGTGPHAGLGPVGPAEPVDADTGDPGRSPGALPAEVARLRSHVARLVELASEHTDAGELAALRTELAELRRDIAAGRAVMAELVTAQENVGRLVAGAATNLGTIAGFIETARSYGIRAALRPPRT